MNCMFHLSIAFHRRCMLSDCFDILICTQSFAMPIQWPSFVSGGCMHPSHS
jgi:hypothetical protein